MVRQSLSGSTTWRGVSRPKAGELLVSEIFGPTIQGEGPYAGQPATFVRVGACNLACTWCDTKYTWDTRAYDLTRELQIHSTSHVQELVLNLGAPLVVITGGEPALQAAELAKLADSLRSRGRAVHLETSGSIALGPLLDSSDFVVVSPKLTNSGVERRARLRWHVLREIADCSESVFKFVVRETEDLAEIDGIVRTLSVSSDRVWIMPEAVTREELMSRMTGLTPAVAARGWSLSPRLQVQLWNNERGH